MQRGDHEGHQIRGGIYNGSKALPLITLGSQKLSASLVPEEGWLARVLSLPCHVRPMPFVPNFGASQLLSYDIYQAPQMAPIKVPFIRFNVRDGYHLHFGEGRLSPFKKKILLKHPRPVSLHLIIL